MTVLLESIDLFIVLLKGGAVCTNTEPHPCIHNCMNNLIIIAAKFCIGPCPLHYLFFVKIIKKF